MHVHRGFPGKFQSSNLSRDNLGREIARNTGVCEIDINLDSACVFYV